MDPWRLIEHYEEPVRVIRKSVFRGVFLPLPNHREIINPEPIVCVESFHL